MKSKGRLDVSAFYQSYKDLILLITGFLLTGIIGTGIAHYYQKNQQAANIKTEQLRIERESATKTATEISDLIGKHHFNALQLRGAIETYMNDPTHENLSFLHEQSAKYRSTVQEWNTKWNNNRARLRMMFGSDFEATFYTHSEINEQRYERSLTGLFNAMHNELVKAKAIALSPNQPKTFDFTTFDNAYHAIGYVSYEFYNGMIREIQNGTIGTFNTKPIENLAPTYAFPTTAP